MTLREALEEAGLVEVPPLEEKLSILATVAQIAPLMGLLGTVLGFIKVFSVLQAPANATLDQTKLFAEQVHEVYKSFPETAGVFQITLPSGGFGCMVTKPWSQRTKTAQQLLMEGWWQRSPGPSNGRVRLGLVSRHRSNRVWP